MKIMFKMKFGLGLSVITWLLLTWPSERSRQMLGKCYFFIERTVEKYDHSIGLSSNQFLYHDHSLVRSTCRLYDRR